MTLPGQYFDGKNSIAYAVDAELSENGWIVVHHDSHVTQYPIDELKISPRIGNTPRRISLPDGCVLEILENDILDQWLTSGGVHGIEHQIFQLESRWSYALIALISVAIGSWAFIQYGIPALSARIASQLPTSIDDRIGGETLALMDEKLFERTQLPAEKQQPIRQAFVRIIAALPDKQRYRLEFRKGGEVIGANAFALPSGIVVVTDELVLLSQNVNEVTAVLAHEVGHVVNRHTLRMMMQSSATALIMFGLVGDVHSISTLAASMPTLLTQAKYSREHETEADNYAYEWMQSHGIATHYFSDILNRLETQRSGSNGALSYFSSHPQTRERINDKR